jgi:ubiquinone/menaquinone biosynthesis C-methylase UbiE
MLPMARIIASDLREPMLAVATADGSQRTVEWRQADAGSLPANDASFDVVVCQLGVMSFSDRTLAFTEARRVLKRTGRFLFNV